MDAWGGVEPDFRIISDFRKDNIDSLKEISTDPEELKKALHVGQIPEAYASVIQDMKAETVRRKATG